MDQYFGSYETFHTTSKDDGGALLSADNLIGDVYDIQIDLSEGEHKAWLVSRFDRRVGYFDAKFSRELSIRKAGGMTLKAVLSFVAFTNNDKNGYYWGEAAVICFDPTYSQAFERFIENVSKKLQDSVRVRVNFDREAVKRIVSSEGEWVPDQTVPMPKKQSGTVIMKDKRSVSDKMIEQGRKGNKGCYAISWAFIIGLVVLAALFIKSCAGL